MKANNKYIEMMKNAKSNTEAINILRQVKADTSELIRETEDYYFAHLKEICTEDEYDNAKGFVDEYLKIRKQ